MQQTLHLLLRVILSAVTAFFTAHFLASALFGGMALVALVGGWNIMKHEHIVFLLFGGLFYVLSALCLFVAVDTLARLIYSENLSYKLTLLRWIMLVVSVPFIFITSFFFKALGSL